MEEKRKIDIVEVNPRELLGELTISMLINLADAINESIKQNEFTVQELESLIKIYINLLDRIAPPGLFLSKWKKIRRVSKNEAGIHDWRVVSSAQYEH